MKLTDRQTWALHQLVTGVRKENKARQTLGGYAGTGKTTLIKYLTQFFPNFAVAAYTGKAANVLRKKGIPATTIHGKIYEPKFDDLSGGVYFDLAYDVGCEGFIIDEASMVTREIYEDLETFGLPMIFVGDHGQLEPVDSDFNLMEKPEITLEEIHRNAGDIAKFAEHLRKGWNAKSFKPEEGYDGSVEFLYGKHLDPSLLASVDQVICAFNKTRVDINNKVRKYHGYDKEGIINVGERVMCLRNNKSLGLFNGMQGTVTRLHTSKYGRKLMDFQFDGHSYEGICYDPKQFGQEKYSIKGDKNSPNPFDYAYCITAHKAQGDEWEDVLVVEQKCQHWEHKRWAYTAASRPKTKLRWKVAA